MTNRQHGFAFFDTPIGRCAVGWRERGIVAIQLPEARPAETRARLLKRLPGARETSPTPEVEKALEGIQSLLRGEGRDLTNVVLDMNDISPFHRRVYEMARTIPPGDTLSVREIASRPEVTRSR